MKDAQAQDWAIKKGCEILDDEEITIVEFDKFLTMLAAFDKMTFFISNAEMQHQFRQYQINKIKNK